MKRTADMRATTVFDLFLKSQIVRELHELNRLTAEKMTEETRVTGTLPYPQKEALSHACAREGIERLSDYLTKQLNNILGHDTDKKIPTLDDVRAYHESETIRSQYAPEILAFANPELFWNFYASHEWPAGDWHALYRSWILRRKEEYRETKPADDAKPKPDMKKLTPSQLRRLDSHGRGMASNYL